MVAVLEYERPYLYPKQLDAFFTPERYSFIEASTKAGKTVAAIAWILEKAFAGEQGQNFWWVAPVADQAKIAFTRVKANLTRGTFHTIESPTPKIVLINGTIIWFKSGDNPDSLYGEDVFAGVVDEASRVKEESWIALRSTLTATQGPVRVIGNVKGRRNWFYRLARIAEKEGSTVGMKYTKITVVDAVAAGIIPESEIADARRTMRPDAFRELYFAEPSDDGGNPFGLQHIEACTIQSLSTKSPVAFGIDLAKKRDWLVVIGLDEDGLVCVFDRWQHVPWPDSINRIHKIVGEDIPALVDSTGGGDPVLDSLQRGYGNFTGYHFSNISKQKLMEGLAVSIQSHEINWPDGPIRLELESFEYRTTPTNTFYSAPEGEHDDCVCALALAREQWKTVAPGANLIEYIRETAKQSRLVIDNSEPDSLPSSIGDEFARQLVLPPSEETITDELTELYNATIKSYDREATVCRGCGAKLTGPSRVTDGVFVWHPECAGLYGTKIRKAA